MNKTIFTTVILIILAGFLFWGFQSGFFYGPEPVAIPDGIILFYGDGCPHCKIVDDFIVENKIEEKVSFTRLEVWYNKVGADVLAQIAQKCGISEGSVGVPFLYDPPSVEADGIGKCYVGDVDTINFFKNAAGIN